jgi:hypothetical protein
MFRRWLPKHLLRDIGSLLSAASYGPFGAFGAIVEATGPDEHTRLSASHRAVGTHAAP